MATLKELIRKALQMTTPTGTMLPFAGKSVPEGWLLCNGAAVSRTTYAKLYAAIGTTWGSGDGSTTFNLPNCEGRFLEGTTNTSNVGTYLSAGLPNIAGELEAGGGPWISWTKANGVFVASNSQSTFVTSPHHDAYVSLNFFASNSSSYYGNSSTVQPASAYALIIIKV